MIFHKPTGTAIFTPSKSASSSLHTACYKARERGFVLRSGPALWDRHDISNHCNDGEIRMVDHVKVERRALLVRNPYRRIPSIWKHVVHHDGCGLTFREWLAGIEPTNWLSPSSHYCLEPDIIVHAESLEEDMEDAFGFRLDILRENISEVQHPELSQQDKDRIWDLYKEDFELGGYFR